MWLQGNRSARSPFRWEISGLCVSQVGDPLAEWTTSSISGSLHKLILAKLQPDSLYEVEMAARNCAGLGQPAMMTFRTGKGTPAHTPVCVTLGKIPVHLHLESLGQMSLVSQTGIQIKISRLCLFLQVGKEKSIHQRPLRFLRQASPVSTPPVRSSGSTLPEAELIVITNSFLPVLTTF